MPRSRPVRTSFTAGEWSPLMQGRVDLQKYLQAAAVMENVIIQPQGGFMRRPGSRFVAPAKTQDYDPLLVPFEFGPNQSDVIEIGDRYARFYTLGGQLIVSATDASITNGDFSAGLTGWTDTSTGASSIAVTNGDVLVQAATGTAIGNMTVGGGLTAPFGGIASGTGYRYHRLKLEGGDPTTGFGISHVAFYTGDRVLVADAAGTALGNLTANPPIPITACFNQITSRTFLQCAHSASSPAYIGKDWGVGVTKKITGFRMIGARDKGFKFEADPTVTVTLQGSTDNFASSVVTLATLVHLPVAGLITLSMFDDDVSGDWLSCARSAGDVAYIGKHWSGTKTLTGFAIRGSVDHGFKKGENPKITATLQGSSDNFVADVNDLATATVTDRTGPIAATVRRRVATGTAYAYHRIKLRGGKRNIPIAVSQLQFYENGTGAQRLRLIVGATGAAAADQSVSFGASYRDVPHTLRFRVTADHGAKCSARIGHASDLFDILPITIVGDGTHALTFIPSTSPAVLQFRSYGSDEVQIDDVDILVDQPYEIKLPYTKTELPQLKWEQFGDTIWLAHPNHPLRKLIRRGNTSWTCEAVDLIDGPYLDINLDDGLTITPSAASGSAITLTASQSLFKPGHVGSLWRICAPSGVPGWKTWEPGVSVSTSEHRKYGDNVYKCVSGGTTGNSPPIHDRGTVNDGVVDWIWRNRAGWGYVVITAYTSSTVVTAKVKTLLDPNVTAGTAVWREGAFSAARGYAEVPALVGSRFFLGKGIEGYLSSAGLYEDFSPNGQDDDAIYFQLEGAVGSPIQWALGHERIIIGTARGPWIVRAGNDDPALTPKNLTVRQQNSAGSADLQAIKAESAVLYFSRSAQRLYELSPAIDQNGNVGYKAVDVTVLASHVLGSGARGAQFAKEPHPVIWAWRGDGQAATLTYNQAESVVAWSRQIMGGSAPPGFDAPLITALAVIPGANDAQASDEIWMCVRRAVSGVEVRHIEYVQSLLAPEEDAADAWYADCALRYTGEQLVTLTPGDGAETQGATGIVFTAGAALWSADDVGRVIRESRTGGWAEVTDWTSATEIAAEIIRPWSTMGTIAAGQWQMSAGTLSGLDHLEGETLRVLIDGGEHADVTVSGGAITLEQQAFEAVAGLPSAYRYESLKIPEGGIGGPAIASKKRISRLVVGVASSGECNVGFSDDTLQPAFKQDVTEIGRVPALVTGELLVQPVGAYSDDLRVVIAGDGGRPLCVTHIVLADLDSNEMS